MQDRACSKLCLKFTFQHEVHDHPMLHTDTCPLIGISRYWQMQEIRCIVSTPHKSNHNILFQENSPNTTANHYEIILE